MALELVYTSVPRGLNPGSSGFCTVAHTRGMSAALVEALESLSAYRPVAASSDWSPVAWSHQRLLVCGRISSVLSRVAPHGFDHTGRTNKFAHHVVLEPGESVPAGPAWVLEQTVVMRAAWEGEPCLLDSPLILPSSGLLPSGARRWEEVTGDAGWARYLAGSFLANPSRPIYLVYPAKLEVLPLIREASALLEPARRWDVTFSTHFTEVAPGATCVWRGVLDGLPGNEPARGALVIDLRQGKSLGKSPEPPRPESRPIRVASVPELRPVADVPAASPVFSNPQAQEAPRRGRPALVWALGALLAVAAGLNAYLYWRMRQTDSGTRAQPLMAKPEPELPVAISHEKCEAIQQELEAETGKMEGRVAELDQRVQDLKESEGQAKDNVDDLVARLRGAELALDETSKKLDALKPPCHLDLAEELKQVDKLGSCKVEREFEGGDARNFRLLRASGASGSDEPQGELVIKRDGVLLTIRVVDKKLVLEKKGERAFELPDGLIGFTFEFDGDRRCVALFKEWRIHWEIDVTLEDAVVAHLPLPAELLGFFFAGLGVEQQSRRFLAVTAAEVDIDIENWTLDAEVKALPDARGIIELRKLRKDVREIEALLDSDKKEGGYGASQLLSKLRTGDDQVKETVEKLKGLVAKLDGDKPHVSEVKKEIGEIVKNDIQPPLDELEDELAQPIEIVLLTREGPRVEVDITLREREPG